MPEGVTKDPNRRGRRGKNPPTRAVAKKEKREDTWKNTKLNLAEGEIGEAKIHQEGFVLQIIIQNNLFYLKPFLGGKRKISQIKR